MHIVNWETDQRPKSMGGLGVDNFLHRNPCVWPVVIRGGSSKSPWHFISQTIDLIAPHTRIRVGNGTSTSFWKDFLLDCGIICSVFPRLFRLALQPDFFCG